MSRIEIAKSKIRDAMAGMNEDADDEEAKRIADIISGIEENMSKSFLKKREEHSSYCVKELRQAMLAFDETKAHKLLSVTQQYQVSHRYH